MTVTYNEYRNDKQKFFKKHKNDFNTYTSPLDEYNRYYKTYTFADGAIWTEVMSTEWETAEVEVKKVKVTVEVKMFRTEYYSTETPSKYYYEKY